jgi:hypothetical protein
MSKDSTQLNSTGNLVAIWVELSWVESLDMYLTLYIGVMQMHWYIMGLSPPICIGNVFDNMMEKVRSRSHRRFRLMAPIFANHGFMVGPWPTNSWLYEPCNVFSCNQIVISHCNEYRIREGMQTRADRLYIGCWNAFKMIYLSFRTVLFLFETRIRIYFNLNFYECIFLYDYHTSFCAPNYAELLFCWREMDFMKCCSIGRAKDLWTVLWQAMHFRINSAIGIGIGDAQSPLYEPCACITINVGWALLKMLRSGFNSHSLTLTMGLAICGID